jgi:hypothetical protein
MHHLDCFRFLQYPMLLLTTRLLEGLMDEFAETAPGFTIGHDEEMVAICYQMGYQGSWTVRIEVASFVDERLDEFPVCDYKRSAVEALEGD